MLSKTVRTRADALLAFGAAVLLVLSAAGVVAQAQDVPTQTIGGRVVDAAGNPITGAQVQLADLPEISTNSVDDGSYELTGVPVGDHTITALASTDTSTMASQPGLVTVGADNAVNLDLTVLAIVPDASVTPPADAGQGQGQNQPSLATDTPVPTPVPSDTPVPEATATPVPTPTPTQTAVPLAALSGNVKNDQGLPPPSGTRVQLLDLSALQGGTGADGAYTIRGIPLGRHFVYAMDPIGKVSDTVEIPFNGNETRSFVLQAFQGGNATRFGGVVTGPGGPLSDAVVWRLGGSGRTTSDSKGRFLLIDATSSDDSSESPGAAPRKVSLVAAKGDMWGYLRLDLQNNTPSDLSVNLDQSGTPPSMPKAIAVKGKMRFKPSPDQFFVAKWTHPKSGTNPNSVMLRIVKDDGTVEVTNGNSFGNCVGKCDPNAQGWIVKLPLGQSFSIEPWNDDTNTPWTTFDWDEGQVVQR